MAGPRSPAPAHRPLPPRQSGMPRDEPAHPMAECWTDSNGCRNTYSVALPQPLVKHLCRGSPAQRLSRPCVEGGCHGSDLLGAVHTQIGAFREVLTQQSVGVLVGATLPWAMRIAEVDLDACIDLETSMLGHLGSLIPGQRAAQLFG